MKTSAFRVLVVAMTSAIFLGAGCAWQGDLDALRERVNNLQGDMEKTNAVMAASTKQALETATVAAKTSEQAAKAAQRASELSQQAVVAAQDANTKTARMLAVPSTAVYALEFGINKSRVSNAMAQQIDEILSEWNGKAAAFQVVGHADKMGSKVYNMSLSQKRADEVKAELVRRGVPASIVSAIGVGEKDPAVRTKDGSRLRANRLVVLTVLPKRG